MPSYCACCPGSCSCHRWWPAAGAVPGVSLQEFEVEGFTIPANKMLMMCNHASLMDPTVYQDPDK